MSDIPFERTVCACPDCVAPCRTKPGYMLAQDVRAIVERLMADGSTLDEALGHLRASPGALVMSSATGALFRIGTITPRLRDDGSGCIFLGPDDRCTVHDIAPFGCAFFDLHMSGPEGTSRSLWGLNVIQANPLYREMRDAIAQRTGA